MAERIPFKYPNDLVHLDRWMCSNCGLMFDFMHDPSELGWIDYVPAMDRADFWVDKDGNFREVEIERKEICPRCKCDLGEFPLRKVFVATTTSFDEIRPLIKHEDIQTEFMVIFPKNAHELAKEITAFSTTQGGNIFLGVKDNGDIVGLQGYDTLEEKDELTKRIRGSTGVITPKVRINVEFVSENNICVAMITVQKGSNPIYFCNGKAYIRDLEESRPATVDEVVRLVSEWKENI